jgi:predicted dehydrogenase
MSEKPVLRVGLIGTGFMGKAHVFGFASAQKVFDLPYRIELHTVADITEDAAARAAADLGFARSTADWRSIIADPDIDLVDITAPNALHKEMALAAIAAGKHVYCEKPLAPLAADAGEMAAAASARGVKTQVGFNYLCNPMLRLAREMVATGELGRIRGYRGLHAEDYMADASGAFTFRHDPAGGGALADIGSHALATAEFLLGPITEVMGDCVTLIAERPDGRWTMWAAPSCVSPMARRVRSKATGSPLAARCSMISKSTATRVRFISRRSASTNCISIPPPIRPAVAASAGSRLRPITRPMAASAWRPVISSASTT